MAEIVSTSRIGNGNGSVPLSRRAFVRGLPRRMGGIEDAVEAVEQRLDANEALFAKIEARLDARDRAIATTEAAFEVRLRNFIGVINGLAVTVRRIDRRSVRSRRRLAVIADQLEY
jgi:hypothetical protein